MMARLTSIVYTAAVAPCNPRPVIWRRTRAVVSCLAALLAGGCFPHETRALSEKESEIVGQLCSLIAEHAAESRNEMDLQVSHAVGEACRDGRIYAFEDNAHLPDGTPWHGAVVMGRLYLHHSVLDGSESLDSISCPYPLWMMYHEGVHLTQAWVALLFSPKGCEDEAHREAMRFDQEYGNRRRR